MCMRDPFAVLVEARRRHHAVIGHGGARVVELQQEAGIDDHLYSVRIASAIATRHSSSLL